MTDAQFRQTLRDEGFGEGVFKDYPPNRDGDMHTHDVSVKLLVITGEFRLATADRETAFGPGEICELPAGTRHVERAGPTGARILLGRR